MYSSGLLYHELVAKLTSCIVHKVQTGGKIGFFATRLQARSMSAPLIGRLGLGTSANERGPTLNAASRVIKRYVRCETSLKQHASICAADLLLDQAKIAVLHSMAARAMPRRELLRPS
jgi:hypothetical protein